MVTPPSHASGSPVPIGVAHVPKAFAKPSLAEALKTVRRAARLRLRTRPPAAHMRAADAVRGVGAALQSSLGHARPAVWVDDGLPA